MTIGTLAPNEQDLYKIVNIVRQLAEGRSNISASNATALLNVFTGDSGSGGAKGLVPAPAAGDALKVLLGNGTWDARGYKAGSFTRDMSSATGAVSYTGAGFTPKAIFFLANINGASPASWGFTTGAGNNVALADDNADAASTYAIFVNKCIYVERGGGNNQNAAIGSFDGDGFTLAWTKTGSPTGTLTGMYVAMR